MSACSTTVTPERPCSSMAQPMMPRTSLWPGSPKMRACQLSRTNFWA